MRSFTLGLFKDEDKLLHATNHARKKGWKIHDVYTPFPVHGIEQALGLKRSRLPIVCFLGGAVGCAFAFWLQIWTSAYAWPINVGGKPFHSIAAFVPVAFEVTVLFGALTAVGAFLYRSKLFPGKKALIFDPDITNHMFVLAIEISDASVDDRAVKQWLLDAGSIEVRSAGAALSQLSVVSDQPAVFKEKNIKMFTEVES